MLNTVRQGALLHLQDRLCVLSRRFQSVKKSRPSTPLLLLLPPAPPPSSARCVSCFRQKPGLAMAAFESGDRSHQHKHTNRLADEHSPYLLQHAHNPDALFLDNTGGGYFSTPEGDSSILFRVKEDYDGAEPSPNSVTAINLVRLSLLLHGDQAEQFRRTAEHLLGVFELRIKELPVAVPLMCCAADLLANSSKRQIVIAGQKQSLEFQKLLDASHQFYDPYKAVIPIDPSNPDDEEFWQKANPVVFAMAQSTPTGKALAYVCQNFTCQAPVDSSSRLLELVQTQSGPKVSTFKLSRGVNS